MGNDEQKPQPLSAVETQAAAERGPLNLTSRLSERHELPLGGGAKFILRCLPTCVRAYLHDSCTDPQTGLLRQATLSLRLVQYSIIGWEGITLDGQPYEPLFDQAQIVAGVSLDVLRAELLNPFPQAFLDAVAVLANQLNYTGAAEKKSSLSTTGSAGRTGQTVPDPATAAPAMDA